MIEESKYNFQITYQGIVKEFENREKLFNFLNSLSTDYFAYMSIRMVQKREEGTGLVRFDIERRLPNKE